ncbi:MAG: hypothetical protein ACT4O1_11935 [Gemmatimonadota bacterium]
MGNLAVQSIAVLAPWALVVAIGGNPMPSVAGRDPETATTPKTVALVSVYGPAKMPKSLRGEALSHQWALDYVEKRVATILAANGMRVLPVAKTAAEIAKKWDEAYFNALEPAQKQSVAASGQPYQELFTAFRRRGKMAHSALTTLPKDYLRVPYYSTYVDFEDDVEELFAKNTKGVTSGEEGAVFTNTLAFRRALGGLVKEAGADAYVLVRVLPDDKDFGNANVTYRDEQGKKKKYGGVHMVEGIAVVIVSSSGEQLYKKWGLGISDHAIPTMQVIKMKYDSAKVFELLSDALDRGLASAFASVEAAGPAVALGDDVLAPPSGEDAAVLAVSMPGVKASAEAKPRTMDEVVGTWELAEVNGQPLPWNLESSVVTAANYQLTADGNYSVLWSHLVQEGGGKTKQKDSTLKGSFSLNGSVAEFKPKGLMAKIVVAAMGNPPMEFSEDGSTAKTIYTGLTYIWKKK